MNKFLSLIPLLLIALFSLNKMQKAINESLKIKKMSIHEFKVENINGEEFDFSSLNGKKIMVVNTASKCGLTPQYEKLEALYQKYKNDNFIIIGFPSNDFMGQEPGSNEEIIAFCKKNYGVSFPMMSKVKVKGNDKCDIYSFLTSKSQNGLEDNKVQWNFQKYLLDENGFLVKVLSPRTLPDDPQISSWIEGK
jgi:glutathione peroxidase